jgi:hypothetical protein
VLSQKNQYIRRNYKIEIKVIDAMMGMGKTTYIQKYIYENKDKKYIYITPYLKEIYDFIGKGIEEYPYTKFYNEMRFREPKHLGEGKLESLHSLLLNEYNIATTHALFKMATQETIDLISSGEYTLVLDESIDVVNFFDMSLDDFNLLINDNRIKIDDNGILEWIDDEYQGTFDDFMTLCKNGTVAIIKKTQKVEFLVWTFKIEKFLNFKEIYIMTYIFESSLLKYYFDMHNVEYKKYSINDYKLVEYKNRKPYDKEFYKSIINIYDGKLNNIGDKETALSLNWFKNYKDLRTMLKNNLANYFKNIANASSDDILWTTFKSHEKHIKNKGYIKGFAPCNIKATDEYQDKHYIAYCCNRYLSPDIVDFFNNFNVTVDQDAYALAEMLQFIFRSAIRKQKPEPIYLYIPSSRMRNLLIDWLSNPNI